MKIVIYIVLILASAALHTYHPKQQNLPANQTHINKGGVASQSEKGSIAFNNVNSNQVAVQSN